MLKRNTNKGRKKSDQKPFPRRVASLLERGLTAAPIEFFLQLDTVAKETKCLTAWKNLRKYVHFIEVPNETGASSWILHHDQFLKMATGDSIGQIINDINPIRPKKREKLEEPEEMLLALKPRPSRWK